MRQAVGVLARAATRTPLRLAFFAAVALACTWPLLSTAASLNSFRDEHPLVQYEESARRTVVDYGEVPLWDPYYCGGLDGLGTPQSRFVSPTFLLTLAFGTIRAEAIVAFLMIFLGLEGTYRYSRSRRGSHLGSTLAAPLYAISGMFAMAPALGWFQFFGYELLPWAAFGLRIAMLRGSRAGVAICAGSLAWMVGFGGTYPAPMAALWCAFEVIDIAIDLRRKADRPRLVRAFEMATLCGVFALGLAAIRLWPVVQTLEMAPRIIGGTPGMKPRAVMLALLGRIHPDEQGDFPIAGNFLVGGFAALAVGAALTRRRSVPLVVAAALSVWLAAGYAANVSLFAALKALPLYSTLRYPERFLVLFALAAASLAAAGIARLQTLARTRVVGGVVLTLAVGLLLANLGPLVSNHWAATRGRPLVTPPYAQAEEFHQARGTRWALAYYGPMNRGCLSCYDAYPVPQSTLLRGDLPHDEYFEDPSAGSVTRTSWTPNKIELDVDAQKAGRVLVNQNWHPGWRATGGNVVDAKGLLAVDVPAGKTHVVVRFLPRAAVGGATVTLVAALALAWLVAMRRWPRLRVKALGSARQEHLVAAVLPVFPLGIVLATMKEPPVPPPVLQTPSGEQVVVDAPPPGARPIGAKFAAGVTLEAFRLSTTTPAPESNLIVEFDWKVTPDVDPKMGVFVHLVPSQGDDLRADHVMFSDVLEIEKAPPGKTIRDVSQVTIPHDASGKRWTVYVGLWRVRGNGKRVHVEDHGTVHEDEDRLEVGNFYVP